MKTLHTRLWLVGAATYAVATVVLVYGLFFAGTSEREASDVAKSYYETQVASIRNQGGSHSRIGRHQAVPPVSKPAGQGFGIATAEPATTPDRSVRTGVPPLPGVVPGTTVVANAAPATVTDWDAPAATKDVAESVQTKQGGSVRVASTVSMRSGPSTANAVVGNVRAGSDVQVNAAESGWVQITDPTSGQQGWVYSRFLDFLWGVNPNLGTGVKHASVEERETGAQGRRNKNEPNLPARQAEQSGSREVSLSTRTSVSRELKQEVKDRESQPNLSSPKHPNREMRQGREEVVLVTPSRRLGLLQRFRERRGELVVVNP